MRIQALALLKGPQVDDGGDVAFGGADPQRLPDRDAVRGRPRPNTRSLRNQTTLFSYTSSPSLNPFSAQNSWTGEARREPKNLSKGSTAADVRPPDVADRGCLGSYALFVFLERASRALRKKLDVEGRPKAARVGGRVRRG